MWLYDNTPGVVPYFYGDLVWLAAALASAKTGVAATSIVIELTMNSMVVAAFTATLQHARTFAARRWGIGPAQYAAQTGSFR